MKAALSCLCLLFYCLVMPAPSPAQTLTSGLDSLLHGPQGLQARYPNLGLSVGVVRGKAVAYYALGTTERSTGAPIDSTTLFEIGSITKTFTALLLAWEQEKGTLAAQANLEAALPSTVRLRPGLRGQVKLSALATHSSGLPNLSNDRYIQALFDQDPVQPFHLVTQQYLYRVLQETDSLQAPGTYHYNNFAFSLLGTLLAQRAGLTYGQLVQQRIIQPLGLRTTGLTYHTARIAGRYTTKGEAKPAIVINAVAPAGGLKSNTVDLVRYVQAQLTPPAGTLGRAIVRTHQPAYQDSAITMGMGWEIQQRAGHRVYQKDGDTFGNSSLVWFDPQRQVGFVILCNHQDAKLVAEIGRQVEQFVRGRQPL